MPPALINIVLPQHLPGDCAAFSHSLLRSGVITWHISPESLWWKSLANPVKYLECFPVILIPPLRPRKAQNNIKRQSVERDHVPLKQLHLSPLPSLFPSNVRTDVIKVKEKKKKKSCSTLKMKAAQTYFTLCAQYASSRWSDVYVSRSRQMSDPMSRTISFLMLISPVLCHLCLRRLWEDVWHQMPRLWL